MSGRLPAAGGSRAGEVRLPVTAGTSGTKVRATTIQHSTENGVTTIQGEPEDFLARVWNTMKTGESFSDVELEFRGGHRQGAHKVLLKAMSPFFEALLSTKMREQTDKVIRLSSVSREAFSSAVAFILGGKVEIGVGAELFDLLRTADYLQLPRLVTECVSLLSARLTPETCLETLSFISKFHLEEFKAQTEDYVAGVLHHLCTKDEWYNLPRSQVIGVVKAAKRVHAQADDVVDAVLRWLERTGADSKFVTRILEMVSLDELTTDFIYETMIVHPKVINCPDIIKKILNVVRDRMDSSNRERTTPESLSSLDQSHRGTATLSAQSTRIVAPLTAAEPPSGLGKPAYVFVGQASIFVWLLNEKFWLPLPSVPSHGLHAASVMFQGSVLLTGGKSQEDQSVSNRMTLYDLDKRTSVRGPPLQYSRSRHGLSVIGQSVYLAGGYLKAIEEYNQVSNRWQEVGSLLVNVRNCGVGSLGENLLVVGGTGPHGENDLIQIFRTRTRNSSVSQNRLPEEMTQVHFAGILNGAYFLDASGLLVRVVEERGDFKVDVTVRLEDFATVKNFEVLLHDYHLIVCAKGMLGQTTEYEIRVYGLDGRRQHQTNISPLLAPFRLYNILKANVSLGSFASSLI